MSREVVACSGMNTRAGSHSSPEVHTAPQRDAHSSPEVHTAPQRGTQLPRGAHTAPQRGTIARERVLTSSSCYSSLVLVP